MFFKYLSYIIRHKWYVFLECCKEGIPWRGVVHDLSKLRPSEFFPYMRHFYGHSREKEKEGYSKNMDKKPDHAFNEAWLKHIHRNPHHWQYWVLVEDKTGLGAPKVLPMPDKYIKEMVCDWRGAGKAQGFGDNTKAWYEKHKNTMVLHPLTLVEVEKLLRRR